MKNSKGLRRRVLKSSFKKKRTNRKNKIVSWSPDVKQIERPTSRLQGKSGQTTCLLKINKDKTVAEKGKLYAKYKNKKIHLELQYVPRRPIFTMELDNNTKKVSSIKHQGYYISDDGPHRIRVKINFGDVIWLDGDKKVKRRSNNGNHNLNWLGTMCEFKGKVKRVSSKSSSKGPTRKLYKSAKSTGIYRASRKNTKSSKSN